MMWMVDAHSNEFAPGATGYHCGDDVCYMLAPAKAAYEGEDRLSL